MYDKDITAKHVDAEVAFTADLPDEKRFLGIYHSVSEVNAFIAYMATLLDDETGELRRPLNTKEQQWILNEQVLCSLDFHYWASRFARIVTDKGVLMPFIPNVAQRMVINVWAEMEAKGWAIMMIQLKARQLGVSTLTEIAALHRFLFYPDIKGVVASNDDEKSALMARMMEACYEEQPWWLVPIRSTIKIGKAQGWKNNSFVTVQSGNQTSGIARGNTPQVSHICLSPHTLIRVDDGRLKPMSEVQTGDRVVTASGQIKPVKRLWKSDRHHEMTSEIWAWGEFASLSTTRDHRVLTPDGWKEAREIKARDYLVQPVRHIFDDLTGFEIELMRLGRPKQGREAYYKKQQYPLDEAWGYLLGLFLAEGSITKNRRVSGPEGNAVGVVFSIDKGEEAHVRAAIVAAMGSDQYVGISRSNSRTVILRVSHAGLARWIMKMFGDRDDKCVPDWAWRAGQPFCRGLLLGYLFGDGHYDKNSNEIVATSVRVQLTTQMRSLVASLGYGWSSIHFKSAGVYYERNCRASWNLKINGHTGYLVRQAAGYPIFPCEPPSHWQYSDNGLAMHVQVQSTTDGFSETFYDLEVEGDDHTFTTQQGVVHNSELADFHDPGELIDSSLLHAVHPHAGTFLVLESTAKGFDNWWHDKWYSSVRNWQKGTARLCPIFLPWFVGTDKYPTDTWLRMHPIPDGWQPNEKTEKHAEKAALYVQSNPRLQAVYGDHWTMPRRQQWFYEVSYDEAKDEKRLPAFLSEMPSDPDEAFQSTNVAAVELEALIPHRDRAMSRPPVVVLGIKGDPDELPMRHQPSRRSFDTTSKYAAIRLKTFLGRTISEYSLHPLKFRGYDEDFEKRLYVWEWPQNEEAYGLGIDTADGVGQDRTVCTVVKQASIWHPWVQVAEFASSYMNAYDFWPIVQAIALLYTVRVNGDIRQPKIVVECKGNGEAVQHELKKRGWNKFHPWLRYDSKKTIPSKAHKIGVLTTGWFRSLMMDKILKVFNDQEIDIGSPWLVSEFQRLERDEMKQQFRADHGAHDDRVMATAMVIFSMDILGVRPKERRRVEAEVADNEEDEATYTDVHAGDSEAVMAGTFTYQSLKAKPKTVRL